MYAEAVSGDFSRRPTVDQALDLMLPSASEQDRSEVMKLMGWSPNDRFMGDIVQMGAILRAHVHMRKRQ
jgi:hypothetical protein